MNFIIGFFISLSSYAVTPVAPLKSKMIDSLKLGELWYDEVVYYQPSGKSGSFDWNGTVYNSDEKVCYRVTQKPKAKKVESVAIKCEKNFLAKATEPYDKIPDFAKYKTKLISCLERKVKACLRKLFSKTMKTSFGDDSFGDRRDVIFSNWKDEDYKRVKDLLKKGVVSEGDYKSFPPEPSDEGLGYRGHFEIKNGSWVLASFVIGD